MLRFFLVTLLSLVTIHSAVQAQNSPPAEPGTIHGIVMRAGTTEPLPEAQVTLQGGAADPQALQVLLNTAASQGIVVTPAPGASTSDIIQAMADAAAARGFPLTVANLQSQLASLSGKTPPTTTTDREGAFTFKDIAPGSYAVRVQKEGFLESRKAACISRPLRSTCVFCRRKQQMRTSRWFQGRLLEGESTMRMDR
jgi:hypothetical protein